MDGLSKEYGSFGLRRSAYLHRMQARDELTAYADWLVGLTVRCPYRHARVGCVVTCCGCSPVQVASIVVMLMFYSFGYRPAILQMDKDMRRTRSMLLMFPDEVRAAALAGTMSAQLPCSLAPVAWCVQVIEGVERIRNMLHEVTQTMH